MICIAAAAALLVSALTTSAAWSATEEAKDKKCDPKSGCSKGPSYTFRFSGYFKADICYDGNLSYPGNYALWVMPGEDRDVMNVTARQSRLGLDFGWSDMERGINSAAKLEFDFYGLGSAENKSGAMMRHAYLKFTKGRFSVLAGQTSDVISPLVPSTVNYTVCWDQGNIGYRRPQFRVSALGNIGERAMLALDVAATRTLGSDLDDLWAGDTLKATSGNGIDDGADAAIPTVQGRLGVTFYMEGERSVAIGVSGHYGKEEHEQTVLTFTGADSLCGTVSTESWSFNTDVKLVLDPKLTIMGEFFMGQNLGTFFGGIGQSVNPANTEIFATGGWGMAAVKPCKRLAVNAGYAFDDPDDEDFDLPKGVSGHTFKDMNSVIFGNVMYSLTKNISAMLEISQLKTTYLSRSWSGDRIVDSDEDYDDLRIQFALVAKIQ